MNLHDQIARLAYELYVNSGYIKGRDQENWLEAERIILARQRLEPDEVVPKKKQVMRSKAKKTKAKATKLPDVASKRKADTKSFG